LTVIEQLMRPIFLLHIIFAGYMCCTSIFYYLNTLGYEYSTYLGPKMFVSIDTYQSIAECQRYYVLGHAAMIHGILFKMGYPISRQYKVNIGSMSNLLLTISLLCLPLSEIFKMVGPLGQFSVQLGGLSFVAGAIALAFSIREKKKQNIILSILLFGLNLYNSLISGFKEPIIICVLLLGIFLLPVYGKKMIPIFGFLLISLFFILPTFMGTYRQLSRQGNDAVESRNKSFDAILNSDRESLKEDNWAFLVQRISEIDMFIKFTKSTPRYTPFYKTEFIKNSLSLIIPRAIWPGKPDVEALIMKRVYNAGVIDRTSEVSAKPAYIVDSYLSFGTLGVWLGLFLYGLLAQLISNKAEKLFGGYFLGSAVIFAGLFQIFWRGNSFEFMAVSVFWSYITMLIIFYILRSRGILIGIKD
jgi:hypothetical protein